MPVEIERKFLVCGDEWREEADGTLLRQGYLNTGKGCIVRIRTAGDKAFLTIKGPTTGISRPEYEYEIPLQDATELLHSLAQQPIIEKVRYCVPREGHVWEVDEFLGDNTGLVLAEVELEDEAEQVDKPRWVGKEVTDDARYRNTALAKNPYSHWLPDEKQAGTKN